MIRVGFTPDTRAAVTNSSSRTESVDARTIRIRPRRASAPSPTIAAGGLFGNTAEHDEDHDDRRDRHHQIDRSADDRVEQSADVADEDPHRDPDREERGERLHGPDERRPNAEDQLAEQIAPERVGSQPVLTASDR